MDYNNIHIYFLHKEINEWERKWKNEEYKKLKEKRSYHNYVNLYFFLIIIHIDE